MPRLSLSTLPLSLALACTLAACTPAAPLPLKDQSLDLGRTLGTQATQPFSGRWTVTDVPDWLQVSPVSGQGDVNVQIRADRGLDTPLAADQAELTGQIKIVWTAGSQDAQGGVDAPKGAAIWTVRADQYVLTGRLRQEASAQGQDLRVGPGPTARLAEAGRARGIIVKYRSAGGAATVKGTNARTEHVLNVLRTADLSVRSSRPLSDRSAELQVEDVEAALRILRADPGVEYAVPNAILRAQTLPRSVGAQALPVAQPLEPTDQYAGLQWPFRLLGYPAVWRDMEGGAYSRPVTVAVVDSGVRYDHPDLEGQLWNPGEGALDLLSDPRNGDGDGVDSDPTDPGERTRQTGSHGTHVAGLIAARWGQNTGACADCSATGVVGAVRRANVKVLPIRVIDAGGDADIADVSLAVRYAAGLSVTLTDPATKKNVTYTNPHKAAVINLSLGAEISADTAQPMCEAVQEASAAGSLVIVAAGNGYGTTPYYPAACPAAVAVGSVTLSGGSAPKHAVYSNAYPAVQFSAPGGTDPSRDPGIFNGGTLNGAPFPDLVLSTSWNYVKNQPDYEAQVGTSQAAPQVSALAALLLSKGVTTDAASTLARLSATATDLGAAGRDPLFGFGMINAVAALGAPAISDTLGLRIQDSRGLVFQPLVDALGRFTAYLGNGTFSVIGGRDRDGNGIYGETSEPRAQTSVTLGPATPQVDVGDLLPK
ncbi:S8 family serine peptidase [Deinococcus humi]|uniref:Subtilisin family serine protease n=1 Tax=Deinococcus humi TaxID=662880 RepID=A0A7W8JY86_9DEIO|nr:S8 family serine peptidase [Deinococcus humi]MBB5365421.1 subtilisin family serine protease [Deinococcus humi]GGO28054.1 serine protease [Deinococcus humi]